MQRALPRVVATAVVAVIGMVALYPRRASVARAAADRARQPAARTFIPLTPFPAPAASPAMPTYRPPAGSLERMPIAGPTRPEARGIPQDTITPPTPGARRY